MARTHRPSAVVLDLMLPGKDGFEVCRELRQDPITSTIPVVIVSALKDPEDKIRALLAGADDYLTKPFHPGELVARLQARLRGSVSSLQSEEKLVCGEVTLDCRAKTVSVAERMVRFSLTEFEVLAALIEKRGILISRSEIVDRVNKTEKLLSSERSLDQFIQAIRRKLENSDVEVRSVYGRGYVVQTTAGRVRR